jgi:septal ring-binding cell division protein DamX
MVSQRLRWVVAVWVGLLPGMPGALPAQAAPVAAAATGSVTGTVMARDTQRPARFATVMLQSVAGNGGGGRYGSFGGGTLSTRTNAEGRFVFPNVAPGDYYAVASAVGYIGEHALLQYEFNTGADAGALLAGIPQVHVTADAASSVVITMERGGSVSGTVQWEDGSPAAGVSVSAQLAAKQGAMPDALQAIPGFDSGSFATSDDRGVFRLTGLATGDYIVQAQVLQTPFPGGRYTSYGWTVRVYSPGVFHRPEAKAVSVRAGEERGDVRIVMDLRGLHTVSGSVGSVTAGQSIESGRVTLSDPKNPELQLMGSISATGQFTVSYVPPGSYTLQVSGASTTASGGYRGRGEAGGVSFRSFSEPVTVTDADVTGLAVTLTPMVP